MIGYFMINFTKAYEKHKKVQDFQYQMSNLNAYVYRHIRNQISLNVSKWYKR